MNPAKKGIHIGAVCRFWVFMFICAVAALIGYILCKNTKKTNSFSKPDLLTLWTFLFLVHANLFHKL
jgi:hypothetical protein